MDEQEAKGIGSQVAKRVITELKNACFEKATSYEVALEELAALEKDLILETMVKTRPDKEKIKAMLKSAVETFHSDEVKPAGIQGYADSLDNLIEGIDKKDLPVKGDLLVRHLNDIKDHLWEGAWVDIVNCECGDQPDAKKLPTRYDVKVTQWAERDRHHIGIVDKETEQISYADWWDDEARQMFEDGFFLSGNDFENSVLGYAEDMGILAK